ncbi:MAG: hypothetical protein KDA78_05275 [Planctomycetaceae bacterium]|nr:hypothetical protein [Planctomycetaceae bacterium]
MNDSKAIPVNGVLRGRAGETMHVCWQCPECLAWYSDDYDSNLENPYTSGCGWTRKHQTGEVINVIVEWAPESDAR